MFELFDHTADVGLRVRAGSLAELLVEAARGLTSLIVVDPAGIAERETRAVTLAADEPEYLLFDWLNELLFLFDRERFLGARFEVNLSPAGLVATVWGEIWDPPRQPLSHEVKAVTYHGLTVAPTSDGWLAEVILDI